MSSQDQDPFLVILDDLAKPKGTTDITVSSKGLVTLRVNKTLRTHSLPRLGEMWHTICETHLPRRPRSGLSGYTTTVASGSLRFRVTWTKNYDGESLAIRPLPNQVPDAETLRLPPFFRDYLLGLKGGLFLVGGPTGSGKSTTIACALNWYKQASGGKIILIEDPIEYIHASDGRTLFEQREIGTHVESYGEGLKEALHMNPDIICVQEIRERAAAETALAAALSGHLVIASIHAYTAATTPQRYLSIINASMEDVGARDALASCFEGVILQRLVPGRDGLVPIFEIMTMRDQQLERMPKMERMIRDGSWQGLRQEIETGSKHGMCLWDDSIKQRRIEGLL